MSYPFPSIKAHALIYPIGSASRQHCSQRPSSASPVLSPLVVFRPVHSKATFRRAKSCLTDRSSKMMLTGYPLTGRRRWRIKKSSQWPLRLLLAFSAAVSVSWGADCSPESTHSELVRALILMVSGQALLMINTDLKLTALYVGCLTSALRNFVISQSTDVYEHNYMTKRVRVDLARCRLGDLAGSNGLLFEFFRDLSIQRDPDAPIDITEDQRQYMESRNDTTELREALEKAKRSNDKTQIRKKKAALVLHRRQVEELLVHNSNIKYFAEADRLRKLGLPTTHLRQPRPAGPREHSLLDMKLVVQLWTEQAKTWDRAEELSLEAMDWLAHYMAREKGKVIPSPVGSIECHL